MPTLQRLAERALEAGLTSANVVSVLSLAMNLHARALADACTAFASKNLAAVVQTEYFDELPADVGRRLLLCAAQRSNPVGPAPAKDARNAFCDTREFLGIVREHIVELRWRLAEAERAQAEAVARADAERARRSQSRWGAFFFGGEGNNDNNNSTHRGVEYAEEQLVRQRRRVARVEEYHAAQSKLFAALDSR